MKKIDQIRQHALSAEKVWGKSYNELWPLINAKKLRVGVEIGVAFGGHSERILEKTKCKLYSIDPYKHFPNYDDPMNMSDKEFQYLYLFTKKRLSKYGLRCKLLRTTSQEGIKKIKERIDFVYLDGDHSIAGVKYDVAYWFNKLSHGGIIAGHDYGHPGFPGVKKVVDRYFGRLGLKVHIAKNSVWWVEKKFVNISYIIPAYNCETTIGKSVNSILSSNYKKGDEIIIVDDCSTDQTPQIIKALASKNNGIRIFRHNKNLGGGEARNSAVKQSLNNLIFCLDADNTLVANSIAKIREHMFLNDIDAICFREVKFIDHKKDIKLIWKYKKNKYDLLDHLFYNRIPSSSGNYLFTKNAWKVAGGYPKDAQALDTWTFGLRLAANSFQTQVYPNLYYNHNLSDESYWNRTVNQVNYYEIATKQVAEYAHLLPFPFKFYIDLKFRKYNWYYLLDKSSIFRTLYEKFYAKENK